ncbi:MAG TPA: hypothetical protein VEB64_07310 [Azospirillaceae bacterium]|nr:hypothetical protein [Azospirillaceae bacterium]
MSSSLISLSRNGRASLAPIGATVGPAGNGTVVYEVVNCPPGVSEAALLDLAAGFIPPVGYFQVDYDRLAARRNGSCCGGACGG